MRIFEQFGNGDQPDAVLRPEPRKHLLQHGQGLRIRMADSNGGTTVPGPLQQFLQLSADKRWYSGIVQENVAIPMGDVVFFGNLARNGLGGGTAIYEIEGSEILHSTHQPTHMPRMAGQQTPHVVVHSANIGQGGQTGTYSPHKFAPGHVKGDASGPERTMSNRLHGQVQHDLLALTMGADGKTPREGGLGQEREGHRTG